jgi:hypothetical protein
MGRKEDCADERAKLEAQIKKHEEVKRLLVEKVGANIDKDWSDVSDESDVSGYSEASAFVVADGKKKRDRADPVVGHSYLARFGGRDLYSTGAGNSSVSSLAPLSGLDATGAAKGDTKSILKCKKKRKLSFFFCRNYLCIQCCPFIWH